MSTASTRESARSRLLRRRYRRNLEPLVGRFGRRVLMFLIGLPILFVLVFAAVFTYNGRRHMEVQGNWLGEAALRAASTLEFSLLSIEQGLRHVAGDHAEIVGDDSDPAGRKALAVETFRQLPMLQGLSFIDEFGVLQYSWVRGTLGEPEPVEGESETYMTVTSTSPIKYSRVFLSDRSSTPYVRIQVPLGHGDAHTEHGVLEALVDLTAMLWDPINDLRLGKEGYAYVIDRDQRLIAYRTTNRLMQTKVDLTTRAEGGGAIPWVIGAQLYEGIEGGPVLRQASSLPRVGWNVVVEIPAEEAFASIRYGLLSAMGTLTAMLGASLLAGAYLTRRLFNPLKTLEHRAQQLARGRFDSPVPPVGVDEVRRLGGAFNVMAESLQHRERELHRSNTELAMLNEISTLLNEESEAGSMLEQTVAQTSGYARADAGAVYLWRSHGGEPQLGAAWRRSEEAIDPAALTPGEHSPAARTATDGKSRVEDVAGRVRTLSPRDTDALDLRVLYVPVTSHGQPLGTLVLWLDNARQLAPGELGFYESVGSQIGVAIQNEWYYSELSKSERTLSEIVENSDDIIFTAELDGRIRFINPAATRLLGHRMMAFLDGDWARWILNEDRERAARMVPRAAEGQLVEEDLRVTAADNSVKRMSFKLKPIAHGTGRPVGVLGMARDVTESHELQENLAQLQKMESIGTLAGGIAHDFNNLLTGIMGYANLLLFQMEEEDPLREEVRNIQSAAEQASSLTSRILTFSRRSLSRPQPFDVSEVVNEAIELLKRLLPETIRFEWQAPADRPIVVGDTVQVQQIVMNLCINARDAMPDGGTLTISCERVLVDDAFCRANPRARRGRYIMIRVSDTGTGIPDDVLQRIYEPFYTTKERGQGTGLGLAMVYGIVQQHSGFMDVETRMDEGTTFRVYLPQADILTLGSDKGPTRVLPRGTERVMLVDDEEVVRSIARDMLSYLGYTVYVFANGEEALAFIADNPHAVDVAVSDIVMPRLDGRSLTRRLRQLRPDLPIILSSGYGLQNVRENMAELGVTALVEKPYTLEHLAVTVRDVLDAHGGGAAPDEESDDNRVEPV